MMVSLIIPVYKDIQALKLILDALHYQTYKDFEVIVAEDDDSKEVKDFLENYKSSFTIKHFFHEDRGNQKAIILNKAIPHTDGEYLIFIDGDCIPYSTFIDAHVCLSEDKTILCGRRVNLGDRVSRDLREQRIDALKIEKNFFKFYRYLNSDNTRHYEQGIYINPSSFFYKIVNRFDKNIHILGSNFSCYKKELLDINGFDEDIVGGSKDDVDLEWRFLANGCRLKSCKFSANLFHLNHKRTSRVDDEMIAKQQMEKKKKEKRYVCKNGIKKL